VGIYLGHVARGGSGLRLPGGPHAQGDGWHAHMPDTGAGPPSRIGSRAGLRGEGCWVDFSLFLSLLLEFSAKRKLLIK
jgi:hypothetical protein